MSFGCLSSVCFIWQYAVLVSIIVKLSAASLRTLGFVVNHVDTSSAAELSQLVSRGFLETEGLLVSQAGHSLDNSCSTVLTHGQKRAEGKMLHECYRLSISSAMIIAVHRCLECYNASHKLCRKHLQGITYCKAAITANQITQENYECSLSLSEPKYV